MHQVCAKGRQKVRTDIESAKKGKYISSNIYFLASKHVGTKYVYVCMYLSEFVAIVKLLRDVFCNGFLLPLFTKAVVLHICFVTRKRLTPPAFKLAETSATISAIIRLSGDLVFIRVIAVRSQTKLPYKQRRVLWL